MNSCERPLRSRIRQNSGDCASIEPEVWRLRLLMKIVQALGPKSGDFGYS
jgi:hypothetical protein